MKTVISLHLLLHTSKSLSSPQALHDLLAVLLSPWPSWVQPGRAKSSVKKEELSEGGQRDLGREEEESH